jgi:hypothetical protein
VAFYASTGAFSFAFDRGSSSRPDREAFNVRPFKQRFVVLILTVASLVGFTLPTTAQTREPRDKAVQNMMTYAWQLMPSTFVINGREIIVDLKKPSDGMVPLDVARDVLRVARISARAQTCQLNQEQTAVQETLMQRAAAKQHWTDQQLMFIKQLHAFTIQFMTTGITELGAEHAPRLPQRVLCTEADAKVVKEQVETYLKAAAPEAK